MTRLPSGGPFLEFNFYWVDIPEEEALGRLIRALIAHGAYFRRGGLIARRMSADALQDSDEVQEVDISGAEDVERYLTDPSWRLLRVCMEGATNTTRGVAEVVCYGTITAEALLHDHRPLCIYTEGQWTDYTEGSWAAGQDDFKKRERQARTIGRRAKKRFCAIADALTPSYGSITVEDTLPTPWQLRQAADSGAFRDFYVDAGLLGKAGLEELRALFADSYTEVRGTGLYVSTWGYLNPVGRSLPIAEANTRSMRVSRMIARVTN